MKALQIRQYGGKDVLELNQNSPNPVAGKGQVLIEVHAASINLIDWKIRAGYLKEQVPLAMPATLEEMLRALSPEWESQFLT